MATTSPDAVRHGVALTTAAAAADIAAIANAATTPKQARDALFAAIPLIVSTYGGASATLAVDWYEQLREAARWITTAFRPTPILRIDYSQLDTTVAWATSDLYDLEHGGLEATIENFERSIAEAVEKLTADIEKEIADSFSDTITENTDEDPDAAGWRRYARAGACGFCRMLAAKGAVYSRATARFAAHGKRANGSGGSCMCTAAPVFNGQPGEPASVMQYTASKRTRTPEERAALRDYLNENYPDAPG